jgi:hypothetical protein
LEQYAASDENLSGEARLCLAIVVDKYKGGSGDEYKVTIRYAPSNLDPVQYDWNFKEKYGGGNYDLNGYDRQVDLGVPHVLQSVTQQILGTYDATACYALKIYQSYTDEGYSDKGLEDTKALIAMPFGVFPFLPFFLFSFIKEPKED